MLPCLLRVAWHLKVGGARKEKTRNSSMTSHEKKLQIPEFTCVTDLNLKGKSAFSERVVSGS